MKACRWLGLFVTLLTFAAAAEGLITYEFPLSKLVPDSNYIVMAKITTYEPNNKRMIVTVTDDIKGKLPFRQIPIVLEGDKQGKEHGHPAELMKRLAADLPVLMFILELENRYTSYVFTNGTWFEVKGKSNGTEAGVWDLTHGEPYLRRTFKGTTNELRKLVSGKAKLLPPYDKSVPVGFGPEIGGGK